MKAVSRSTAASRHFIHFGLAMLVVALAFSPVMISRVSAETTGDGGIMKKTDWMSGRESTLAWNGDLIVIGASLPGVAVARIAAEMKKKVLLIESGSVLGTDIAAGWDMLVPDGWFANELFKICMPHGGCRDGKFDPFIATLAIDRMMKTAGVSCMVCTLPVRPVAGVDGKLIGVEIAGKSGRQLVTAPYIIDAGPGAVFSFLACGLPVPQPSRLTSRIYVHGISAVGLPKLISVPESFQFLNNQVEIKSAMWPDEAIIEFAVRPSRDEAGKKIPAAAETYHRVMALMQLLKKNPDYAKVLLVDIAPGCDKDFSGSGSDSLRILDNTGITPLPGGAGIITDRQWTETFLEKLFASTPQKRMTLPVMQNGTKTVNTAELSTAVERQLPKVSLPPAPLHWHAPSDIVVAGCGTAGSIAALTAAEQGAGVMVLDALWLPGGTGTAGRVFGYYHGINAGMQKTLDAKVQSAQAATGPANGPHPVAKAETIWRELERAGVQFGVNGRVFGVLKKGNAVTAVLVAAVDGYHVYPCRVAVDATGDGDLAAAAGAQFSMGRDSDGFMLFYGYLPVAVGKGKTSYFVNGVNNAMGYVDPTDTMDYSRAHFSGRAELWKMGPFTPDKHFCTLAPLLGIRQGRSIHGPVVLRAEDFADGKSWPDKVCSMSCNYDRGGFFALENEWIRRWVVMFGLFSYVRAGDIPYRCLYPDGVEGVLLSCRALSVEHDLSSLTRMKRDMQQLGEICGLAAALAVRSGRAPSAIAVPELQNMLRERGILPAAQPEKIMDIPADRLLKYLGGDQNGLAMWRLSRLPENARPDWHAFAKSETDRMKLFCAAVAAAMQGVELPPAFIRVLEQTVDNRVDGPRLGNRSSALCVVASLALAYAKTPGSVRRVASLLEEAPRLKFLSPPDIALLYHALGSLGGEDAVLAIRKHLSTTKPPESIDDYQLQFAAVRELQRMGCMDESQRLKPLLSSDNFMVRKAAMRLADDNKSK
jgi:ribulose 1,5-bisphosphate synthetase/thiazole synthase